MECLMQYLDDLEDLIYAVALAAGRIWRAARSLFILVASIALLAAVLLLSLTQPPLGLAVLTILAVLLLYRAAVNQPRKAVSFR